MDNTKKAKLTLSDGKEIIVRIIRDNLHGEVLEIECETPIVMIPNGANGILIKLS